MSQFKTILQPADMRIATPLAFPTWENCERILNVGLFFDGTDNNHSFHPQEFNTNISKLSAAYIDKPGDGYFSYYVSGIGTPFTEINKTEAEIGGGVVGIGGEARVVYGLLQVVNSMHAAVSNLKLRHEIPELAALCSKATVTPSRSGHNTGDELVLRKLGLSRGLLYESSREPFFAKVRQELREQVTASGTRPRIAAIYLDVFGFSRGAATARVFVSWLHKYLFEGKQLFGVPAYVRMLGLFDTVASVGLTDAAGSAGHNFWAQEEDLRIHPEVKNCLHHVALHELRTNFPVDSVADGVHLPPNCQEHHCPGAHSDVGGGYAPGEQGKGMRIGIPDPRLHRPRPMPDANARLSNLTLKHMYDAAVLSCRRHVNIPWIDVLSKQAADAGLPESFGLDGLEKIKKQVAEYFTERTTQPDGSRVWKMGETTNTRDALRKHGERYLTWRYQLTESNRFKDLPGMDAAESLDIQGFRYSWQGEEIFKKQIAELKRYGRRVPPHAHPKAQEIFKSMQAGVREFRSEWGQFFDRYVHDSFAGFIGNFHEKGEGWVGSVAGNVTHGVAEREGYVRWRQLYQGGSDGLNAQAPNDSGLDQQRRMA